MIAGNTLVCYPRLGRMTRTLLKRVPGLRFEAEAEPA
jgi:hypothetical protein